MSSHSPWHMPKYTQHTGTKQINKRKKNHLVTGMQSDKGVFWLGFSIWFFETGFLSWTQAALEFTLSSKLTPVLAQPTFLQKAHSRRNRQGSHPMLSELPRAPAVKGSTLILSSFLISFQDRSKRNFQMSTPIAAALAVEVLAWLAILGSLAYFTFFKKLHKYGDISSSISSLLGKGKGFPHLVCL